MANSDVVYKYIGVIEDDSCADAQAIKTIMEACDNDFIPPMSVRESACKNLSNQEVHDKDIKVYWKIILAQKNVAAYIGETMVAFLSFRHDDNKEDFEPVVQSEVVNYVSTICVLKGYRGKHITSHFYDMLENGIDIPDEVKGDCVATRTWNENYAHIGLLQKRGFTLTHTIVGDREQDGIKYDTVYYCKCPKRRHVLTFSDKQNESGYKVMVITTGGTIAQKHNEFDRTVQQETSSPFKDCIVTIVEQMNDIGAKKQENHYVDTILIEELLNKDSSNIVPEDWEVLVNKIVDEYDNYKAFVITHGTNTLGYTSAALSFALGRLGKPVVLTGSQVSFGEPGSDAQMNLENALRIATYNKYDLWGVMVVFGSKIINGTRVKKTTEYAYDAFKAFGAGKLIGDIGNSIKIDESGLEAHRNNWKNPAKSRDELEVANHFNMNIASFTEFPGMTSDIFNYLVDNCGIKGFILRSTGAGDPNVATAGVRYENLRNAFDYLRRKKIPIIVTTQAPDGTASMDINTPGKEARKLGAIPARDMSMESMTVKLAWLIAKDLPYEEIRKQMGQSDHGEIK
jgi:L-asparaginase